MKIINYLNRIIEFSFYFIFLLVPLVFAGSPSELFEFPKMWLTFGLTIIIVTSWILKMILQKKIHIQRTPLDIPLLLFLASHIISTIYSLDPHVSLWGYYSRFNGGLLSMISYVFLYYAFVSNLQFKQVVNLIKVSLFSGFLVALWGFPSHFGYDPTCFIFRGSFDTSCWTDAFKPTIRIFSTLGQPAWLAAYVSVLIPLSVAFPLLNLSGKKWKRENGKWKIIFYSLLALLFYACLTYTDTRGGFIGFWIANLVFWGGLSVSEGARLRAERDRGGGGTQQSTAKPVMPHFLKYFLIFNLSFLAFNFLQGIPISQVSKFILPELSRNIQSNNSQAPNPKPAAGALGGTDSGEIRLLVWRGAIDAWRANPIFGTGVETFAFAYYKYRPIEHNLTSEWDYLYNKAHNEYLNYLSTTGIFGLGSYLAIIGVFVFQTGKWLMAYSKEKKDKENEKNHMPYAISSMLIIGLLAGYISILVSNFFGFSVVIVNLYFFLIPAFVFILGDFLNPEKSLVFPNRELGIKNQELRGDKNITALQWFQIAILLLTSYFLLLNLTNYWNADISYALGSNLDKAGSYQEAIVPLQNAVGKQPNEPVYRDELSINLGTIAAALYLQKDASGGAQLAKESVDLSDQVVSDHPNNIVYWKNRVRLFYTLAQGDSVHEATYLNQALTGIERAHGLAPNDAKVSYNYAVLAGQIKGPQTGIKILENTIKLKPDYRDAYFALGLYYRELAVDKDGNVTDPALQQKAVDTNNFILKNIDPEDKQVKETLKSWEK